MLGTRGPRSTRGSVSGVILLAESGFEATYEKVREMGVQEESGYFSHVYELPELCRYPARPFARV